MPYQTESWRGWPTFTYYNQMEKILYDKGYVQVSEIRTPDGKFVLRRYENK